MDTGFNTENLIHKSFLTPDDMATLFSISRKTVYRLVDRRLVPFHKIGGVLRFRKEDIEEYLNSTRIDPVS